MSTIWSAPVKRTGEKISTSCARLVHRSKINFARREKERRAARRRGAPDALARLKRAFGDVCQYCGASGAIDWTVDRIVSSTKGGDYSVVNITLSCRRCNSSKGQNDAPAGVRSLADMEAV